MIVYFEILRYNIGNIKICENIYELLDYLDDHDEEYQKYIDYFNKHNYLEFYYSNKGAHQIIWNMNKSTDAIRYIGKYIEIFKNSEWYINYMRTNKLNRILKIK
jgi:hypothetical protein